MTQRSHLVADALSVNGVGVFLAGVSATSFAVGTKFTVDANGNLVAETVTAKAFDGPGLVQTIKFPVVYGDLSDPGSVFDLDLGEIDAVRDSIIMAAYANVTQLFDTAGPPVPTNVLLELGHATDPDAYLLSWDARTLLGWRGLTETERGAELNGAHAVLIAADNLFLRATVGGTPNLDDLGSGAVDIYLKYSKLL